MVQPIDYTLNVLSPMQRFTEGLKFGEDVLTARLARDETQQLMGMRAAQEARAVAAEQERRSAAEAERARAEKMQADLGGLVALAEGGNLTTDAINQFRLTYAKTLDDVTNVFTSMEQERQKPLRDFGVKSVTLALTGNAAAAEALYQERIEAAKNAGTPEAMREAQALEADLATLKANPVNFATAQATLLRHADYINDDQLKGLLDLAKQGEKVPESFEALQLRADAAGLVKGTPEYVQFMKSGGKGPETVVTNVLGDAEGSFAKELAKDEAKQVMKTIEAGQTAARNLVELDNLSDLLGNVQTGGAAAVKSWLGELGVATEGLNDIQAFEATVARMIPAQRVEGSGSSSNLDVQQFAKGLPALIKQPGGNQIIIDTLRDINEYDIAASFIAGQIAEWARTPAADRKALEEQGLILSPANGRKAIMDLGSPTAAYKAHLKKKPKTTTEPVVIDGVIIERIE